MHIKDIRPEYFVKASFTEREYVPKFGRVGPFLSENMQYRDYLDYFKLGFTIKLESVFVNGKHEAIDTAKPDVPFSVERLITPKEKPPVVATVIANEKPPVAETSEEETLEEEVIDSSDIIPDNLKINEDEEEITFLKLTKADYNKMTEKKLYDHLKEIENGIPEDYLPLEGKNKKQLLKIIDEVILA